MKKLTYAFAVFGLALCLSGAKNSKFEFSAKDENGKVHSLAKYKGKYLVLEWTNGECPFVVDHYERNTMVKLNNKFKNKNVVWLAVNSSHFITPEKTKKWKSKWALPYPTLQDPTGKMGKSFGAKKTPQMFVFNPQGSLIYQGAIDDDSTNEKKVKTNYVEKALNEAIANRKVSVPKTKAYGCSVKYKG